MVPGASTCFKQEFKSKVGYACLKVSDRQSSADDSIVFNNEHKFITAWKRVYIAKQIALSGAPGRGYFRHHLHHHFKLSNQMLNIISLVYKYNFLVTTLT